MSEWSEEMTKKLKAREQAQATNDPSQAIIRGAGPGLWNAVKSDLMAEGQDLKMKMGREVVFQDANTDRVLALSSGTRQIVVGFNPDIGELYFPTSAGMETFRVQPANPRPAFFSRGASCGTRAIAQRILNALLD